MFDAANLPEIRDEIQKCTLAQRKLLKDLREEVKLLRDQVKTIKSRSTTSISLVASDGGNNKLTFDPFYVQLVRVVDSYGKQMFLSAVSPVTDTDQLSSQQFDSKGEPKSPLGWLMQDLGVATLSELSSMIPSGKTIREHPEKVSKSWVQVYRDLSEWAVLYKMICHKEFATDTLLVRDGLLRSKIFRGDLFMKMTQKITDSINRIKKDDRRNIYLVGLAKHSKVIERYGLALALEDILPAHEARYVRIPRQMEAEAYRWQEWAKGQEAAGSEGESPKFNAGDMYFVRFGPNVGDTVWPVDILSSQTDKCQQIFAHLLADAQDGFPIPYYPKCLQNADKFAQVVDLDLDVLQDEVLKAVRNIVEPNNSSRLDNFLFTQDFTGRRYQ